jgi:hypothetical protein
MKVLTLFLFFALMGKISSAPQYKYSQSPQRFFYNRMDYDDEEVSIEDDEVQEDDDVSEEDDSPIAFQDILPGPPSDDESSQGAGLGYAGQIHYDHGQPQYKRRAVQYFRNDDDSDEEEDDEDDTEDDLPEFQFSGAPTIDSNGDVTYYRNQPPFYASKARSNSMRIPVYSTMVQRPYRPSVSSHPSMMGYGYVRRTSPTMMRQPIVYRQNQYAKPKPVMSSSRPASYRHPQKPMFMVPITRPMRQQQAPPRKMYPSTSSLPASVRQQLKEPMTYKLFFP